MIWSNRRLRNVQNLKTTTSELTGKITKYEIEGIEGEKPVYIDVSEIVAITAEEWRQQDNE